ncbi:cysteine-rich DPF motif domain-containing protein 1 isoform X1 [Piliocolobus tephrosceles]|nr:cysteine-rich DPF motif domain-containing protein 1 isoform X1 [Piliocolobus tephrosceles]XP_023077511.1 cysteine-rich DPF motif domain-containing protein 1 isoform X1 [Piliocolobus tephrosceles]XP_023077512.1 cysteine-rich DPF motif domain-containing protein 1 isoform X1 [Piliocolobus tephrosceles]XP_023077513.1 cysteine-rich DPF motif domain-containing protein 1 isoform X1 [Piliocolobus tephrosceles]XP_023077514.1 cysteine-rich DPF motif domain-containing protein 1 isoform X1 [Piliocolobus
MASHAECRPLGVFECELCALTAPYSYVGQEPPNTQSMVLLEESYVMKDPFTSHKDRFLVLGSRCSLCSRLVCVGPVGVQLILLQEILPPLCPGEHQCFSSGNSARLGEKESSIKEDPQPARFSDVSAARAGSSGSTLHRAPGPACAGDAAELGAAMPGLVSGPLGAALQPRGAGVQFGAATGPGSCSKRVAQRQMPDKTQPGTWPGVPTCPSGPRPE